MEATQSDVLAFWFEELKPEQWFKPDVALDTIVARRFGAVHATLERAVPESWRINGHAVLAAVIVLDQFPRNMFRGTARAFATDGAALALSTEAIRLQFDHALSAIERQFLYMPFQHAEDLDVQRRSVDLFAALGNANVADYAERHQAVIARFGRFPHRNAILGRTSTAEEVEFLKQPGSSF
ncbi:MAG: DUF924 domain-containing protein [Alphaproteobacteria bacterium]|nr:DUF924 domain-containing protein [Alphaproteobacteria bacterium]